MSRLSTLAMLAQLMLKNHHELQEALNVSLEGSPLQFGFKMGGTSTSMSVGSTPDGSLSMSFAQNGNTYRISIPSRADSKEAPKVTVTLESADGQKREHVLEGATLFNAQFDGVFAELHQKVVAYLKKTLSKERLDDLQAPAATSSAAATSGATSPATDASAQSTGETAATAAPAPAPAPADPYTWYRIQRQDQPDLRFRAELKGRVQTPIRNGRQHVYSLFQTPSGKWVAVKEGLSMWVSERNIGEVQVFDDLQACVPFFGYSWLSKALYAQVGLTDQAEEVLE